MWHPNGNRITRYVAVAIITVIIVGALIQAKVAESEHRILAAGSTTAGVTTT